MKPIRLRINHCTGVLCNLSLPTSFGEIFDLPRHPSARAPSPFALQSVLLNIHFFLLHHNDPRLRAIVGGQVTDEARHREMSTRGGRPSRGHSHGTYCAKAVPCREA